MKTVMSSFSFFLPVPGNEKEEEGVLSNKILPILVICLLTLTGCLVKVRNPWARPPPVSTPGNGKGPGFQSNDPGTTRVLQIFNPPQGIFILKIKKWNEKKKQAEYSETTLALSATVWRLALCQLERGWHLNVFLGGKNRKLWPWRMGDGLGCGGPNLKKFRA